MKTILAVTLVCALAACSPTPSGGTNRTAALARTASGTASDATAPAASASAAQPAGTATASAASGDVAMLPRYHWRLASAVAASGRRIDALSARAGQPLQLDFGGQRLAISNTCNRMHGSYSVTRGKLELGALASTMMACQDPAAMALDAAVGEYLRGTLDFALDTSGANPRLTLTTGAGDKLAFDGVPTPETRYGSVGEIMFLEVAPHTQPCNHPLMPSAQCLQVRELHYDAQGTKSGPPGPWHTLGQTIEGYTHQPGVRNVLRVKRYRIAHPPADAPSVAYVLDMVVESEASGH